jgi:hypothetical protein
MRPLSRLAGNQNYGTMLEHLKIDMTLKHQPAKAFGFTIGSRLTATMAVYYKCYMYYVKYVLL